MTSAIALARLVALIALGAIGTKLILAGREPVSRRLILAGALTALAATAVQVLLQAALASGDAGLTWALLETFLARTWGGRVALVRLALIAAIIAAGPRSARVALALVVAALLTAPIGGHAGTAAPAVVSFTFHALHAAAAGLWIGGLLVLAVQAFAGRDDAALRSGLTDFSPWALGLVMIAIAAGIGAAMLQVERWAALFGTAYGQLLLAKIFLLLLPALLAAAWLRQRFLAGNGAEGTARRVLIVEALFGLGVMMLGVSIAQTVPGRHDAIDWPFAFRFAPEIVWKQEGGMQDILVTLTGGTASLILAGILFAKGGVFRQAAALCGAVGVALFGMLAYIVSVPAWPTTFAATSEPYTADVIMRGRRVFLENCVVCHGKAGHGDGPGAGALPIAPADLTAPHTEDHTAGDMFWWIGNGMPSGAMPGVGDAIADEDKWALITYIRALSSGYSGRDVQKRVIPRSPWLGAIDFNYQTGTGENATLNDWRGQVVVLLVLIRDSAQVPRVKELLAMAPDLAKARTQILIVSSESLGEALGTLPDNATLIETDTGTILDAWSLYRRTFWDMDSEDERPAPPYMEFLIDRFGYVRLRGRSDDETLAPASLLALQAAYLAEEPQSRPPPDEHVH
ncbi:MAG: c-type cytochrome [Rhizobiales bacterium]|nr:c-type cytochrome [Hyphomicrobiales bacterium]